MDIEFDPAKDQRNIAERGLSLALAAELDWSVAAAKPDTRVDYNEDRFIALAPLNGRLFTVVYVMRGSVMRVISLRKANQREIRSYESET